MELKNVTIGYLTNTIQTGIIENGYVLCNIERNDIGKKVCIIDNGKAVDVDNFSNQYEVIKRDSNHRIVKDQLIENNVIYALELENVSDQTIRNFKKKVKQYKKLNR